MKTYDVIIIGAGLVGLVLATALLAEGFTVAVVDGNSIEPVTLEPNEYQLRVSAINLASINIFRNLDVWPMLRSARFCAFETMRVWDNLGRGEIEFNCTDIGTSALGYIFENAILHNALLSVLKSAPNVTFYPNTKPLSLENHVHYINVETAEQTLSSKLIVGADGANSWVRSYCRMAYHSWSYNHEALVATVHTERPHQKTAWQNFLPEGPLAFLPLSDEHTCSIVWSNSPFEISRLQQLDENSFNNELTDAFEQRLGAVKRISKTLTTPLTMRHAKEYVKHRVALVGDAAHTIHPLAGQGVNLGFLDAVELAETLKQSRAERKDWGAYLSLRSYERKRKGHNWLMIAGMEFFKRTFQSEAIFAVNLRSLGLNSVNKLDLVKNQFIKHAAGLSDDLPSLAQSKPD